VRGHGMQHIAIAQMDVEIVRAANSQAISHRRGNGTVA